MVDVSRNMFITTKKPCSDDEIEYDVSALNPGEHYIGPAGVFLNPCQCSTVMYSMMGACNVCQNSTFIKWTEWSTACTNVYVGV